MRLNWQCFQCPICHCTTMHLSHRHVEEKMLSSKTWLTLSFSTWQLLSLMPPSDQKKSAVWSNSNKKLAGSFLQKKRKSDRLCNPHAHASFLETYGRTWPQKIVLTTSFEVSRLSARFQKHFFSSTKRNEPLWANISNQGDNSSPQFRSNLRPWPF